MKKLLLLLLLSFLSTQSLAKVGDVYYCVMKNYSSMSNRGIEIYDINNFKFKREKEKLIFDDRFIPISDKEIPITFSGEGTDFLFMAQSSNSGRFESVVYSNGKFHYSLTSSNAVFSVVAECDVF